MNGVVAALEEMPPVTRFYTGACVLLTTAVVSRAESFPFSLNSLQHLEFVTPFHLYFNWELIVRKYQFWRLITSFCFFGSFGFSFLFNMIFTYRYCMMLEEGSFRGRRADFVYMFLFGAVLMVCSVDCLFNSLQAFQILSGIFVQILFLGQAFTIMLVYIWSRRNPMIQMNFFGVLTFTAPYLPWVLLLFSLLLGNNAVVDFMGKFSKSQHL